MRADIIDDDEILYRVVKKSDPDGFIDGKPTAALFIDARGTSVDRDGGREEKKIIESFVKRFKNSNGISNAVKITAKKSREIGTYPNPIHNKGNIYHAEIHESKDVIQISLVKAIQLAKECIIVSDSDIIDNRKN